MANVVSYLEPPETHVFLTTPLSKAWLVTYTAPQELWKILCTSKPFYAKLDENECSSDSSTASFPICNDLEMRHLFGRYRLLYSSFVRCMKYLKRLQDDALNGRTPSVINSNQGDIYPFNKNTSLKAYFAKARRLRRSHRPTDGSRSSSDAALSITSPDSGSNGSNEKAKAGQKRGSGAARSGKSASANGSRQNNSSSRRLGRSMLTDRLLRPTQAGEVDNVNLPWSCAIYSVVNWMVAFADVEGIQVRYMFVLIQTHYSDFINSFSHNIMLPLPLHHLRLCASSAYHTSSRMKVNERQPRGQVLLTASSEQWYCSRIALSFTLWHSIHLSS